MNANQEIIAELRRVLGERDQARRERDEARAEVERLRSWIYRTRKDTQADPNEEITDDPASLLTSMFYDIVDSRDAYRRGAEAMREACAKKVNEYWQPSARQELFSAISDLPIPEEP